VWRRSAPDRSKSEKFFAGLGTRIELMTRRALVDLAWSYPFFEALDLSLAKSLSLFPRLGSALASKDILCPSANP
jgi:hypothetical protein